MSSSSPSFPPPQDRSHEAGRYSTDRRLSLEDMDHHRSSEKRSRHEGGGSVSSSTREYSNINNKKQRGGEPGDGAGAGTGTGTPGPGVPSDGWYGDDGYYYDQQGFAYDEDGFAYDQQGNAYRYDERTEKWTKEGSYLDMEGMQGSEHREDRPQAGVRDDDSSSFHYGKGGLPVRHIVIMNLPNLPYKSRLVSFLEGELRALPHRKGGTGGKSITGYNFTKTWHSAFLSMASEHDTEDILRLDGCEYLGNILAIQRVNNSKRIAKYGPGAVVEDTNLGDNYSFEHGASDHARAGHEYKRSEVHDDTSAYRPPPKLEHREVLHEDDLEDRTDRSYGPTRHILVSNLPELQYKSHVIRFLKDQLLSLPRRHNWSQGIDCYNFSRSRRYVYLTMMTEQDIQDILRLDGTVFRGKALKLEPIPDQTTGVKRGTWNPPEPRRVSTVDGTETLKAAASPANAVSSSEEEPAKPSDVKTIGTTTREEVVTTPVQPMEVISVDKLRAELDALRKKSQEDLAKRDEAIKELKKQHETELEFLNKDREEEMEQLRREKNEAITKLLEAKRNGTSPKSPDESNERLLSELQSTKEELDALRSDYEQESANHAMEMSFLNASAGNEKKDSSDPSADYEQQIEELQNELEQVKADLSNAQEQSSKEVKRLKEENESLKAELEVAQAQVENARKIHQAMQQKNLATERDFSQAVEQIQHYRQNNSTNSQGAVSALQYQLQECENRYRQVTASLAVQTSELATERKEKRQLHEYLLSEQQARRDAQTLLAKVRPYLVQMGTIKDEKQPAPNSSPSSGV